MVQDDFPGTESTHLADLLRKVLVCPAQAVVSKIEWVVLYFACDCCTDARHLKDVSWPEKKSGLSSPCMCAEHQ